jgi:DNA-directed RNA polymerase subunit F
MHKIHDSCDEAIDHLDKIRRVSYHNLKKNICQIRSTSDKVVEALNKNRKVVSQKLGESEIHPSCNQLIMHLGKKCRLSYHNVKKVMRERKKYIATLPFREKLTYHNVKKFVRAEQSINRCYCISQNGDATVRLHDIQATPCSSINEN